MRNYKEERARLYSIQHPNELVEFRDCYSNGTSSVVGFLLNGKREGTFEYYRDSNVVKREIYNSIILKEEHAEIRPNGNIRRQYFNRRYCAHGEYKWFEEDGTLFDSCFYNSGKYVEELNDLVNEPRDESFYVTLALYGIDKEYTF